MRSFCVPSPRVNGKGSIFFFPTAPLPSGTNAKFFGPPLRPCRLGVGNPALPVPFSASASYVLPPSVVSHHSFHNRKPAPWWHLFSIRRFHPRRFREAMIFLALLHAFPHFPPLFCLCFFIIVGGIARASVRLFLCSFLSLM